ncbi:cyclase family protein [Kitasatospora sp. GP82]|uniref:cyclase family protein n=1 Tax=Kitasatospora sp. GP82 TaxID=3035089 RepID=UPI00247727A9|nr:cyclase family protein [Kitasatospora sp. GP82]MDH6125862.1 kynurenine formamidase [Kitasatospora sp. GP82]
MTRDEFDAFFDQLRRDRLPGPVAGAQRVAAAGLVQTGEVVAMGRPWDSVPGPDNRRPALHQMTELADVTAPEPTVHKDFIASDYHGKAQTHLDALCHIAYRGLLFAGVRAQDAVSSQGASYGAVTELLPGLVGRGVLLDVARLRGRDWLEPGEAVGGPELLACAEEQSSPLGPGDILLVRTGHLARRRQLGAWDPDDLSAGLHPGAMRVLSESRVSALGGDGDSDVRPSPVHGVHSPIHVLAITAMGLPLIDNMDLEALAETCARTSRWEFLFVTAPLNIPRGTGSPVNPLAVF